MSFKPYPTYKDSGVEWLGRVPEHWESMPFRRVFRERQERSVDGSEELLSVSAYTGVRPRAEIIEEGEHLTRAESLEGYKICRRDDLVMNIMLAWNRGLAITEHDGIVSPSYCVFQVINGGEPRFLHYLARSDEYTLYFKAFSTGVIDSRLRLYPDTFGSLTCVLPPLSEQVTIATFLDHETAKIDTLIAEQQRLIELLQEKRQAVISHAVTKGLNPDAPMKDSGIEWLGEVPEHWDVAAVRFRFDVQLGKMLDTNKITGEHLRAYLRVFDVQWGLINTEDLPVMDFDASSRERFRLAKGDLLVNEGGSYPGRSAVWRGELDECYFQKALHRLRACDPSRDTTEFFFYVMSWATSQGVFTAGGNESTIEHLPAEKFRKYRFAFPPLSEQLAIASFLQGELMRFDTLSTEAQHAIALLQERRSALISAAVTGQIDVRGFTAGGSEAA